MLHEISLGGSSEAVFAFTMSAVNHIELEKCGEKKNICLHLNMNQKNLIIVLHNPPLLLMQVKVNPGVQPRALPYQVPLHKIFFH